MTGKLPLSGWLSWLPFGAVPYITPESAAKDLQQFLIIDVRTAQEFKKSHIPGSISIPLHTLNKTQLQQLQNNKPVLCICRSAHRSKPATRKFLNSGFDAYELQGGMLAWWKLKLPLEEQA
ncbi:Rhodanese-related sulfurtransferase [Amphritea atlantica]|uniref:Rhodanese-related sulfurtransferase n=1 Tax=Amphritea atlantica TaxID=355243 RepID=A0A1H9JEW8_9GAMM|nr:rhodanese-like domain-containing protein [Amphritea atlantica]SEQ85309.1 Rhodanese-related sulfurtransferase [Amphritea atlantica]